MDRSSTDLVEDASRGETEAIELLLEKYLPTAAAVVRRRMSRSMRSREESLDLVQSACRRALERSHRYSHLSENQFRSWLLEIVENKIVDRYREQNALKREADREVHLTERRAAHQPLDASADSPSAVASRKEAVERVRAALCHLPEDLRRAVELHELEGRSYEAIAGALSLTLKQARLRVMRAKLMLGRLLGE